MAPDRELHLRGRLFLKDATAKHFSCLFRSGPGGAVWATPVEAACSASGRGFFAAHEVAPLGFVLGPRVPVEIEFLCQSLHQDTNRSLV